MPRRLPPQGPLTIQGSPQIGATLHARRLTGTPTYQWQHGLDPSWSNIPAANDITYQSQTSDGGQYLRVIETAAGAARYSLPFGPLPGPRHARVTWAQITIANPGARKALVTWAKLTTP